MACQVTRFFANRACLDALGRQLQPSRDTGELTAQMQRLWQDLPQGVISDLIEMLRRISACIAARVCFAPMGLDFAKGCKWPLMGVVCGLLLLTITCEEEKDSEGLVKPWAPRVLPPPPSVTGLNGF
ncbi:hypothetical protein TNCV_4763251 [Trichonephila clavipes]|nr:hypothetical protein TNCV_4763251 [Trichonephila clavipes]